MTSASLPIGVGPSELAELHDALRSLGATVACAESLTAGLLTASLTATPGASATVRGALVVYATDLKVSLAGVPQNLLAERGAVDADVARALAHGARDRLGATFGVGLTGVAGPDPQDGKAVGTVFIACAGPTGCLVEQHRFQGRRDDIRRDAVAAAVRLLSRECGAAITALRFPIT